MDEIHRFNKAQQAFLPRRRWHDYSDWRHHREPSFGDKPLLSRARVLVLEPLTKDELTAIIKQAAKSEKIKIPGKAINFGELSGGDARVAPGNLELAAQLAKGAPITPQLVETAAQNEAARLRQKWRTALQHY